MPDMMRCKECRGQIYWNDSVREWRHYSDTVDHTAVLNRTGMMESGTETSTTTPE